jgi:putative transposase
LRHDDCSLHAVTHPYPRHLSGFSYRGKYMYSLAFTTWDRRQHFANAPIVDLVLQQVLRATTDHGFQMIAYCFMPDHLHLLVEGLDADSDLLAFVTAAKKYSGYYFAERTGQRLWQRYGYERVVRGEVERFQTLRYIVNNPVVAGLVTRAADYPFLGSQCHSVTELLELAGREPSG